MEKFAVDLDKVLDDFELDEDENESSTQYDKLQLEFCRESAANHATLQDDIQGSSLGAVGGWPNPVKGIPPPGIRSPPDGQLDEEDISPRGKDYYSKPLCQASSLGPKHYEKCNNSLTLFHNEGLPSKAHSSNQSQDLLWPNISSKATAVTQEINNQSQLSDLLSSSIKHRDLIDESTSNGNNLDNYAASNGNIPKVLSYNLDVVPSELPLLPGNLSNIEVKHPDILHIQSEDSPASCNRNNLAVQSLIPTESSIPMDNVAPTRELLLPDLMSSNSSERNGYPPDLSSFGTTNPAVVTENSLAAIHNNRPAIVEESQLANRIPEVANVHQSTEHSTLLCSGSVATPVLDDKIDEETSQFSSLSQNICDRLTSDMSSNSNLSLDEPCRSLPDVSAECQISSLPSTDDASKKLEENYESGAVAVVKFDPNAAVDELDLNAVLEELEEEHIRLKGAYNTNGLSAPFIPQVNADSTACRTESSAVGLDLLDGRDSKNGCEDCNQNESLDSLGQSSDTDQLAHLDEPSLACGTEILLNPDKMEEVGLLSCNSERSAIASVSCHSGSSEISDNDEKEGNDKSPDCEDNTSSESTGTISSSGTLTDGETVSPDHHVLSASDSRSHPDSPLREPPFSAVYDDGQGSTSNQTIEHTNDSGLDGIPDIDSEESGIGMIAPFWIPDLEAPFCQECNVKFTVIRRRHHCRACGRVLCAPCCHFKAPLPYMEYKEARVCATCLQLLTEGRVDGSAASGLTGRSPNPNNPMEYCSRIPPPQQVSAGAMGPLPTVMVPVGVLKRDPQGVGSTTLGRNRTSKQVIFSDGIRPGGDLSELGGQTQPSSPYRKSGRSNRRMSPNVPEYVFDPSTEIGPLEEQMRNEESPPVVFALQKNLCVLVKLIKLDCCMGMEVWNVATRGLCNVGQEELVVLLEANPGEKSPPSQLFAFFHTIYLQANKGNLVTEMGHSIFTDPDGFLGSKDHGGFLYIRPTFQCLHKLVLPPTPYIFAVLIQKWETPWAKVFPLRLMLRLGAEYRYYPCPLVSIRNRKSVYCEIGHTIMNLLVDFRNYAYTVPLIQGFVVHMEEKRTTLLIPRNRYEKVWKALDNSNDHVLALAANFSPQADSHLVTVEDDDGHYSTQAINIQNRPRSVTGASFIVFNGALKSTSGLKAKSSIVEDGLMVQIPGEMMVSLRDALRNMKDFDIPCGPSFSSEPDELVLVRWSHEDRNFNVGIKSPIDDRQMDGVPSVKIHSATDYMSNVHLIRWTEVFIIQGENTNGTSDINISRLSESLARACCIALITHLMELYTLGNNRVALRATIHQENVGFEVGSGGNRLPSTCMNELDTELIPVIHRAAANITDQPVVLELLFHIMEQ